MRTCSTLKKMTDHYNEIKITKIKNCAAFIITIREEPETEYIDIEAILLQQISGPEGLYCFPTSNSINLDIII